MEFPRIALAPIGLYGAMLVLPYLLPSLSTWADGGEMHMFPWLLLLVAAGLGACFAQSRITLCSLLLGAALFRVDTTHFHGGGVAPDPRGILMAGVFVPLGFAIYHRLNERGLWNSYGAARAFPALAAAAVIAFLPRPAAAWPDPTLATPLSGWFALPPSVLGALLVPVPMLCVRKQHESPVLGLMMAMSLAFFVTALNFQSTLWQVGTGHGVFLLFMTGSALSLIAAVIESAWRNANVDELTQLPGRRALKHYLAGRTMPYTVAIFDIDHFKRINDRFGHDTGDQVLRYVAGRLRTASPGRTFRYGGEEFMVICEGRDHAGHAQAIEAARQAIGASPFRIRGHGRPRKKPDALDPDASERAQAIHVTASAGVAPGGYEDEAPLDAMREADKALYRAKKAGRDRMSQTGMRKRE